MGIALDALSATNTFANNAVAKTAALTIGGGSNRALVAFVGIRDATVSAITFNGVALSLPGAFPIANGGTANLRSYIYYLLDASLPAAGTYNLSVTPSVACWGNICCVSLTGVRQIAPEATGSGFSTGTPASWANNITPLSAGAWIFEASFSNDRTFTPDGAQTERFDFKDGTAHALAVSSKELAIPALTTMGQTPNSGTPYAQAIAAFAPALPTAGFFQFF